MIRIKYAGVFVEMFEDFRREYPELGEKAKQRIKWFRKNPDDTRLVNHPLRKQFEGKWAFSINEDIRVVYEWIGKTTVRFLAIGPHRLVYKRN